MYNLMNNNETFKIFVKLIVFENFVQGIFTIRFYLKENTIFNGEPCMFSDCLRSLLSSRRARPCFFNIIIKQGEQKQLFDAVYIRLGPFIKDVINFFEILDPLSPLSSLLQNKLIK